MSGPARGPDGRKRYSVAVDFDGVLHSYTTPWVAANVIPDPPVPGAIEWLHSISEDFDVIIHTTRGKTPDGRSAVRRWLDGNGFSDFVEVTATKPAALVYIDDRGWRFEGTFPTPQQIHDARPWNKPVRDGSPANWQPVDKPSG